MTLNCSNEDDEKGLGGINRSIPQEEGGNSCWCYFLEQVRRFGLLDDEVDGNSDNGDDDSDSGERRWKRRRKRLIVALSTTSTALIILMVFYKFYRRHNSRNHHSKKLIGGSSSNQNSNDNNHYTQYSWIQRISTMNTGSTLLTMIYHYQKQLLVGSSSHLREEKSARPALASSSRRPDYLAAKEETPMSFLLHAAKKGLIQRAYIGNPVIYYQTKDEGKWKKSRLPHDSPSILNSVLEDLAQGGCSDVTAIPESFLSKLTTPLLTAVPFIYLALVYKMMQNMHGGQDISSKIVTNSAGKEGEASERTTFNDVAGLNPLITELSDVVSYLSNPNKYREVGATPPRGLLLYGPPGSGKTLLARAIAGESKCDTFIACTGSDFVEMYVGRGAARIRSLFNKAKTDALNKFRRRQRYYRVYDMIRGFYNRLLGRMGDKESTRWINSSNANKNVRPACAILFIDELDALAKARSYDVTGSDEREQTLNQLLTEMDGFYHHQPDNNNVEGSSSSSINDNNNVTLIVIAASNRADILDPAILRRFDRQLFVPHPDAEGRKAILLVHARQIPCCSNGDDGGSIDSIDWDYLASEEMTDHFSGADLRNLINEAALLAARENCLEVNQSHLNHAARRIRQMKSNLTLHGNSALLFRNNSNNENRGPFFHDHNNYRQS